MDVQQALTNWRSLTDALAEATEEQCKQLLDAERDGAARLTFIQRIYGRYNTLRDERERRELAGDK
jgi:hypothetical protein